MKVFFETFGCKVNMYETSAMTQLFEKAGYERTGLLEEADVVVINSCTVTENSDRKARAFVRKARSVAPDAVLLLCGCFSQAFPDKARELSPDILMGTTDRRDTVKAVQAYLADHAPQDLVHSFNNRTFEPLEAEELVEHTRAFLKIQDGCEKYCSYCAIPKARGPVRSLPLAEVRRQCENLAKNGYKEIVLCGINLSAYGIDLGIDLGDAVLACSEVEEVVRIRLSSLECDIMTDEMLHKFASCDKFCPQFHLSLQSGCDRTLRRMNRHYTSAEYYAICEKIRAPFQNPTFTTDIIVGFPGETDEDFNESVDFCRRVGFLRAHVFPYSRRRGTMADNLPDQIPRAEKERRSRIMISNMKERSSDILNEFIGKNVRVILEQSDGNGYSGYSDRYLPCRVYGDQLEPHQVVEGTVEAIRHGEAVIHL